MAPVLSATSMREADRLTMDEIGIPDHTLMESAGREAAEVAEEMIDVICGSAQDHRVDTGWWADERAENPPLSAHIVCLCGKGNNGGDGLVMARYLSARGHRLSVVLFGDEKTYTGAAAANLSILEKVASSQSVAILSYVNESTLTGLDPADLVIDALLGTGLQSNVRPPLSDAIDWVNHQKATILAVDIPTGLCADSGHILGHAVRAHVTVTMGALKAGLLIGDGPELVGALHVVDIGIPPFILNKVCHELGEVRVSNADFVSSLLPVKSRKDHKYAHGPTIVVAGSKTFPGAPVLACLGAAKAGSGYVVCVCPPIIRGLLEEKLTEIPVESWEGEADHATLAALIQRLDSKWTKAKALLVGPGLGRKENVTLLVKTLLQAHQGNAVVDADALFALRDQKAWVQAHSNGRWVFTPHDGEFAVLSGGDALKQNRIEAARALSNEWNVVVLLKGLPSIIASPDGQVVINPTGNPSVGTAGTGDVLSGIVAGLLAQGLSPMLAALSGIHIAGTAADLFVEERAAGSMMAHDILEWLPVALASYR